MSEHTPDIAYPVISQGYGVARVLTGPPPRLWEEADAHIRRINAVNAKLLVALEAFSPIWGALITIPGMPPQTRAVLDAWGEQAREAIREAKT